MLSMQTRSLRATAGFTLVEMIVSLALFSVVTTVAVGSLLSLITANQAIQAEQDVLSGVMFALDSMSREIRTGTQYDCIFSNTNTGNTQLNQNRDLDTVLATPTEDCETGRQGRRFMGVSFIEGGNSITGGSRQRILYYYDQNTGQLYRRIGVGSDGVTELTGENIYISDAQFYVQDSYSRTPDGAGLSDNEQAMITIFLEAYPSEAAYTADQADPSTFTGFRLQTTVTQRTLDL
jgi:prepilin-type N-terminal cleavage/methylation domain-containing protein